MDSWGNDEQGLFYEDGLETFTLAISLCLRDFFGHGRDGCVVGGAACEWLKHRRRKDEVHSPSVRQQGPMPPRVKNQSREIMKETISPQRMPTGESVERRRAKKKKDHPCCPCQSYCLRHRLTICPLRGIFKQGDTYIWCPKLFPGRIGL
jgi:hypothetical protein